MADKENKSTNTDSTKSSKGQWHGGKGSLPRKGDNKTAYDEGWERIFGKGKKDKSNNNS